MVGKFHSHLSYRHCQDQFQQAFHTAHVSAGAMAMKKREFRYLCQGGWTVGQYVDDFSKLARYAPDDVAMDATK